jgi:hypothetical protein
MPDDRLDGAVLQLFLLAREVAAGDVAGFVGDDADHLVGGLGLGQQAGVDEDLHPVGDEGVDALVVDDVDLHRRGIEAGGGEDRIGIGPQGCLDLGVADQAATRLRRRIGHRRQGQRRGHGKAGCAPCRPLHARQGWASSPVDHIHGPTYARGRIVKTSKIQRGS